MLGAAAHNTWTKKLLRQVRSSLGSLQAFHQERAHVSPGHSPEPPHIAVKLSQLKAGELLLGWRPQQMFLEFEEGGRRCMQVLCCFIRSQLHSCPASPLPCPAAAGGPPEPFASLNLSSCLLPEHPGTPGFLHEHQEPTPAAPSPSRGGRGSGSVRLPPGRTAG